MTRLALVLLLLFTATGLQAEEHATKPQEKQVQTISSAAGKMGKALLLTVAGLLAVSKLYKQFSKKDAGVDANRIQIISRKPVGPRSELLLVSVDGQRLLLSNSPEDTHLLSEIHDFASVAKAEEQNDKKEVA